MKKALIFLMMAVFMTTMTTSCTGTFKVTKAVYKFHRSQEKWVDEILFLAFSVFQVYSIATLGDAIIFNSIEFWTGRNPIASNQDNKNVIVQNGKEAASMKYDAASQDVEVTSVTTGKSFILTKTDSGVVVKDANGKVLFSSVEDSYGGVTIFDENNNAVKHYSADEVLQRKASLFR